MKRKEEEYQHSAGSPKATPTIPTTKKTSTEGLARLFRDNMWKLHGLLESMISDRELQFAAELM